MRRAMFASVSAEDMTAMVKKLVELAREGNVGAIKLVLAYAIGKPAPALDPDEFDIDSDKGYTQLMKILGNDGKPMAAADAELLLEAVRTVRPEISRLLGDVSIERLMQAKAGDLNEAEEEDLLANWLPS